MIIRRLPAESLALQLARRPDHPWSAVDVCYVEKTHHRKTDHCVNWHVMFMTGEY